MNQILCPTDFSPASKFAVEYAAALSHHIGARLVLLHAYEAPVMFSDAPLTIIRDAKQQLKQSAQNKLDAIVKRLIKLHPGLNCDTKLLAGLGSERILEAARDVSADAIVMGATGTSRLSRLLIGSTTAAVIRDAECPVLCIPKEAKFKGIHRIAFATDLQEDNLASAMTVTPFAKRFDAELSFVFVDDKHLLHSDEEIDTMSQKIRRRVKYPKLSGYIAKNPSITKGLEQYLKKQPADLLVMFTHPRHFAGGLFNQSVTKMMSHQVRIPLLAIRQVEKPVLSNGEKK